MTTYFAAIDATDPVTGAVYAIGLTVIETRKLALHAAGYRGGEDEPQFRIVPITRAAADYVQDHNGGAPSPRLTVTARGVCLRTEER